jgi:NADH-quinone oxidoreductase subunit H
MFASSAMAITLFLGGWSAPLSFLAWVPSYVWFFAKLLALIAGFIWIRGTLPRLRMDQLMGLAWKFMLPMALLNIVAAATWKFIPSWPARWLVCGAILIIPCVVLSQGLRRAKKLQVRSYQFAE